ncbi:probable poly-beta-hydroxybutyrate polymerase [Roseovarius sp. TM1035]|uniref:PHA/PHB synthase family protein n=1 Tax=Roseovarius sp. TM1035 TaxID=391613 RepID=UPI0001557692|nr:alpha/beta fold hydrolase [Roseovarius sp. TM1035]AWZ19338.1 Polyhydroxyalkanoic acid synthase [Roseovarius sp. AK1035]EDM33515.1 probable poly-beta-hydroxybutyrate polymerase [Roseovarius sp. TM1035]
MAHTPSRSQKPRSKTDAAERLPLVVPLVQTPAEEPSHASRDPHPHAALDRSAMASLAQFTGGLSPHAMIDAWSDWAMHLGRAPGRQLELMERWRANALKLMQFASAQALDQPAEKPFKPGPYDTRWSHQGWDKPPFSLWQQGFLATQDWWHAATSELRGLRRQNADRTGFMMRQLLDTVSPSNFPLGNPEILEKTRATGGRNLIDGAARCADDARHILAQEHRPVPKEFALGKVLACTPGAVVYRNDLMELIQYSPTTSDVQAEPVLIVPAWIMKYYILDLSPENSLVRWLVGQGFTVFCISWRNPGAEDADLSLEAYRKQGVMQALDVINDIVPGQKVHANGYCLGGTLLAIAAAAMARDGEDRLASVTLMAAQVDFAEAGELLLFLDESQVAFLEDLMWSQGYLDRPQMSGAFAAIRSEDLIWSRAVRRYFLGEPDLPTDVTVWVNDTTRMPARMHSEYLRGIFLENRISAGRFAVDGKVIALKDISGPVFVIGTETDHIAPWRSVYKTALFTDCDLHFLLTKGGHNSGILSEPGHRGRHYRIGHRPALALYRDPDTWLAAHDPVPGSWWPEWSKWLARQSSGTVPARQPGTDPNYPSITTAPGTYIHRT